MGATWSAAVVLIVSPGCAIFTDLDTGGYRLVDAGDAQVTACDSDANCSTFGFACVGAADCPAGQICCLAATSTSSASFACEVGPVCASTVQLCKTTAECRGAQCISQRCNFGGPVIGFQACGSVPSCSAGP